METKHTIMSELQQLCPTLATIGRQPVNALPEGYFEMLPTQIMEKIALENLLNGAKGNVYTTPKGYFQDLAGNLLEKARKQQEPSNIALEELQSIAPFLAAMQKQQPYKVPDGYFEGLSTKPQTAKVIGFSGWRKIVKYAVAAVFAGVITAGGVKFLSTSKVGSFEKEMAKSSDAELKQVLEGQSATVLIPTHLLEEEKENSSIFEGTNDDELKQYLSEQTETAEKLNKDI